MIKNKGLGRGLGAIFEIEGASVPAADTGMMQMVELSLVRPNPKQPRTVFDEDALEELADSIKTLGVIQPVTVKREDDGTYTIISGERRCRASQLAGLETVPAYIREATDQTLHEMALVENIQREDLNALEVAISLQRLLDECGLTQDTLAERVGKKRSTVANYMRLLRLPVEVQAALGNDHISMGHAKAIASLQEDDAQLVLLRRILKKSLSVRQAEEMAKVLAQPKEAPGSAGDEEFPESYTRLVEHLEKVFTPDISIKKSAKGGGRITIGFASDADVEDFLRKLSGV